MSTRSPGRLIGNRSRTPHPLKQCSMSSNVRAPATSTFSFGSFARSRRNRPQIRFGRAKFTGSPSVPRNFSMFPSRHSRSISPAHDAQHCASEPPRTTRRRSPWSGVCYGSFERVRWMDLLDMTLAGPAAEVLPFPLDWERSHFQDFDDARRLIRDHAAPGTDVETYMRQAFEDVQAKLWHESDLIDDISARLVMEGKLSARTVAALCREHGKRS